MVALRSFSKKPMDDLVDKVGELLEIGHVHTLSPRPYRLKGILEAIRDFEYVIISIPDGRETNFDVFIQIPFAGVESAIQLIREPINNSTSNKSQFIYENWWVLNNYNLNTIPKVIQFNEIIFGKDVAKQIAKGENHWEKIWVR
jgi:hypothetical protein